MSKSSVEKAILFIATNFRNKLTLEVISKNVGVSKFYFHRLFKQEVRETLSNYINKIRLEHAAHFLVMYPDIKILEVAFECGYSYPSVFSREFNRYYKISPLVYRKKNRLQKRISTSKDREKLPIVFIKKISIEANSSNLLTQNINKLFISILKNHPNKKVIYGVFFDFPVHKEPKNCRYYAGVEALERKDTNVITIDEGYYTYIDVKGHFDSFSKKISTFKEDLIDNSPYKISSLIAFERIQLTTEFNYFSSKRRIYIRIKRK